MLSVAIKAAYERAKLPPSKIQDIAVGNNLQPGAGEIPSRMAELMAEIPDTVPIVAINRLCSSGLEACGMIAAKIKAGHIDVGIGSGVESMSLYDMNASVNAELLSESVFDHEQARNCLMGMGMTSENVAEKFGISKDQQDKMAVESHQKAWKARDSGFFKGKLYS